MTTRRRRSIAAIITSLALAATPGAAGAAAAAGSPDRPAQADPAQAGPARTAAKVAPVLGADAAGVVEGRYIVVFDENAPDVAVRSASTQARGAGGRVHFTYSTAVNGFAATLPERAVRALQRNPNVAYLEADAMVSATATQSPATWGLDRIDQRSRPLDSSYTYTASGAGVTAYVIDTGIRASHADFGGRVSGGYTAISDGRGTGDCNGHGTHVAGTVGGATYGVAKDVGLVPVRVLGCDGSGTNSGVIAGVDWVSANHSEPAVANMSLGGGASNALDTAVRNSIAAGVTYAVAAGNDNRDACNYSPARVTDALTVGSTTSSDARSSFSNYGTCLDLFAPGSSITSAWYTSNTATNTISGTSMASPHVAGVAALYLQGNPGASPTAVNSAVVGAATPDVVSSRGSGSPNRLLYSLLDGDPPPPEEDPVARHAGDDRYDTSVNIGQAGFPDAGTAVIVSGEDTNLVDGLVAGPLAHQMAAPVLLTERDDLPDVVAADLQARGATAVTIIGGEVAVESAVETELEGMGIAVDRLAGDTRWDTAALVAAELGGEDTVVASGVEGTLVDALSAGGPAANGGWAILLTERDEVPAATQAALEDRGGERVVVGGPMVVSDAVVDQIGAARAGGSNRYETATETSTFFEARGVPTASIALASGEDGHLVDALAGGALGQLTVLTRQDDLPDETTTWITDRSDGLDTVNILGGEVAVSENVADEVRSILE